MGRPALKEYQARALFYAEENLETCKMKPPLKYYQKDIISYAEKNPYSILAADPGLGKSRVAIEVRENHQCNCLVVCPSYLILNWVKEIKLWSDTKDVQITTFKSGKQIYEPCDSDYVLISYDLVQKAEHLFEWADMIILDEAHAIKSMKAKRTTFLHKNIYENSIKRVHLLTGTPIKNRVQEFYSLLALCHYNPNIAESQFLDLFTSEIDFADRYSFREQYDMELPDGRRIPIIKWSGLQRADELKTHLRGKYFRVKSSDVLDLPPVLYKSFQISDDDDEELIRAFMGFFSDEEDREEKKNLTREDRTGSVFPEHKKIAALKKVPFTIKYARDLLEEVECVLIYSDHIESTEQIAREFGVEPITGKVDSSKRFEMADRFQNGEGRVLACTIGSMKEGKDLFRSSHIIFNDLPWVPGDMKQVIYRIQRIGQKSKCVVHKILGSPQDAYIAGVLEGKMKTIEGAL